MTISETIRISFQDHKSWYGYYSQLNDLFCSSKLKAIHDAKTISVAKRCLHLVYLRDIPLALVYKNVLQIFPGRGKLELSDLIDMSTLKSFALSINAFYKDFIQEVSCPLYSYRSSLTVSRTT